jgi:hypothetical protein
MKVGDLVQSSKLSARQTINDRKYTVDQTSSISSSDGTSESDGVASLDQYQTNGTNSARNVGSRRLIPKQKKKEAKAHKSSKRSQYNNMTSSNREEILAKCKQAIESMTYEIEQ